MGFQGLTNYIKTLNQNLLIFINRALRNWTLGSTKSFKIGLKPNSQNS